MIPPAKAMRALATEGEAVVAEVAAAEAVGVEPCLMWKTG